MSQLNFKQFFRKLGGYVVPTVFATLWLGVAYLAVQIPDNIGVGYSPAFDDGFGWLVNFACIAIWMGTIIVALGLALWRYRRFGYFLSLLTVSFASFGAYRYWNAVDAINSAVIAPVSNFPLTASSVLPGIWSWPTHELRQQLSEDLNSDRQDEIVLIDEYHIEGSANERIIEFQIWRLEDGVYTGLLSQRVDEGRVYAFEQGCPIGPSRKLGYHASILLLNIDADSDKEVYVHQAISRSPPKCRYDRFFDWNDDVMEGSIPSPIWLWIHILFPYSFALLLLGLDYAKQYRWLVAGLVVYSGWAAWELWLGSYSIIWLIAGLLVMVLLIVFRYIVVSHPMINLYKS